MVWPLSRLTPIMADTGSSQRVAAAGSWSSWRMKMRSIRWLVAAALLALCPNLAAAQCSGIFAAGEVCGNPRSTPGTAGKGFSVGILPTKSEPNINFGNKIPLLDSDVQFGGNYLGWVTSGNGFSGIVLGNPGSIVTGTPTTGQSPGVTLTFPGFGGTCAAGCTITTPATTGQTNTQLAAA